MPELKTYELDSAQQLLEVQDFTKPYYYLAHLLDRILIGEYVPEECHHLKQALVKGQVLELHLFNEEKEIFIVRKEEKYIEYLPLLHKDTEKNHVNTRISNIMPNLLVANNLPSNTKLEIKDYVDFDKESHMAYVSKTVLYRLKRGEL